ncbi:MAG: pyruvate dehydrogenase complex E1 component subunit beta [Parvibaculaceae bacterium]|nr:pyruvate dehydrogenase complex E1 component subunit beta [Parvibaculaceae bacterium]
MSIEILMPALSPTMEEGTLAKWLVKEGDKVSSGDILAEIETDKATMELESIDDGTMGKILVPDGTENVPINQLIATILEDGESADANTSAPEASSEPVAAKSPETSVTSTSAPNDPVALETDVPEGTPMRQMTVREALRDAMAEEMRANPDVFVMGEEVAEYEGAYKVTQGLLDEFGNRRVIDTPITEHGFAGLGAGAAMAGLRPIIEFMTFNFAMQAIDHIINSAAKTRYMSGGQMSCPIVFRGPNGPASRVGAQHSQDYSSWYAHIPGLKVVAPYSAADAKGLLKSAIRDPNPVIFLENEILYGKVFDVPEMDDWTVPIGVSKKLVEGSDVTLVSFSHGITYCLEAMETLTAQGINAELIDLRSLRPLDLGPVIESVKKTNRLVTVEETWPVAGIGAEIAAQVSEQAFDYLDAPVMRVTQKDVPMPYAENLEKLALPCAADVVEAVKAVCYR